MSGIKTMRKPEQGFTLVELAIVMIIIGLLIGGILKGQELIANARVAATVTQIKGIDSAVSTFQDKYNGLPGDLSTPTTRLANCAAGTPCGDAAGNGNGQVTGAFSAAPTVEMIGFFPQLAAADLISGINTQYPTAALAPTTWGGDYPVAQIGGGFMVSYFAGGANFTGGVSNVQPATAVRAGHYIALSNNPGAALTNAAPSIIVTPNQAYRIDAKLDDGSPATGSVFPFGPAAGGAGNCTTAATAAAVYNEVVDQNVCGVYIRFHQ